MDINEANSTYTLMLNIKGTVNKKLKDLIKSNIQNANQAKIEK